MKLEQQVCSLDLAKKLKELGVKQESAFYWGWFLGHLPDGADGKGILYFADNHDIPELAVECIASALTVAELGEMLPGLLECRSPKFIGEGKRQWELLCSKDESPFCGYFNGTLSPYGNFGFLEYADTEANARAKMLVYLIEKGIVKP